MCKNRNTQIDFYTLCAFLQLMYLHKLVYNFGYAVKIILTYGLWVMKGGGINAH